jgi:hypothetical protein
MPKVVARREGADLDSTFVAVWEPYLQAPWLTETHVLPEIPIKEGVGVRVRDSSATATLLYRRPESRATLRTDTLSSNGSFTLFREEFGQFSLDLAGGAEAVAGSMRLSLQEWPALKVMEQGIENGLPWLRLKGTLPGYPAEAANQPHAGQFVRFVQEGQVAWWLPVAQIETAKNGDTILRLSREIGFMFDAKDKILRETAYPFRVLRGAATVEFPTGANLSWSISGTGEAKTVLMKIRADSITRLGLTAPFRLNSAAVRTVGETEWQDLKIFADGMVELPANAGTKLIREIRMEVLNSP